MMYVPPQLVEGCRDVLHQFIREHPVATVIAALNRSLDAQHLPLLLDAANHENGDLRGHVARANTIWQEPEDRAEVLVIFQGPNHYISPGWYPSKERHGKVVPTWNHIIVHVRGLLKWQHDRDWLRDLLERTTEAHEQERPQPWAMTDAAAEYVERALGGIVGFEIVISTLTGKLKLSQNQADHDRAGVIKGLDSEANAQAAEVAHWMRERKTRRGAG